MEDIYQTACERSEIRGAVLLAASADGMPLPKPSALTTLTCRLSCANKKTGEYQHQSAFGLAAPNNPLTLESTFWIASCTKLVTSVAVLRCVEAGQVSLDEDVAPILHELKGIQILKGFDPVSGEPILEKAKAAITLRYEMLPSTTFCYRTLKLTPNKAASFSQFWNGL